LVDEGPSGKPLPQEIDHQIPSGGPLLDKSAAAKPYAVMTGPDLARASKMVDQPMVSEPENGAKA